MGLAECDLVGTVQSEYNVGPRPRPLGVRKEYILKRAMESITEGVNNINITDSYKKNRIQVSNTKKPLFFYVNLAKVRYMQQHNEVELSALGMGIETPLLVSVFEVFSLTDDYLREDLHTGISSSEAIATVVTVAEILKNNGLAVEKKITTSTVDIKDDSRGRPVQKAKIEIVLGKTANFDELMAAAAAAEDGENGDAEEQNA
ncbi:hypothetical protein V8G54_026852 [Vigna mungo]|uniref:DNA/RNA-binding protein Alba-like domain-containing protein n=1 Tax=Vigna mungo TaxID=3915 RepID=A0AAQ3RPV5_VIGMU